MLSLLKLLEDGQFHSGETLGKQLGVSRSAVWKQLQHIEEQLGISFHKVRGKGYRLAQPLSLLDEQTIRNAVPDWDVHVLTEVDSTNAEAIRRMAGSRSHPILVLAERQTAGRGRRGRKWVSPFGENLYYSVALPVTEGARQLEGLSLVVGLAVLEALDATGIQAGLKWPNDLLVNGKKVAGILLELVGDPADVCNVIIGIGVNVNMTVPPEQIDQPWTSLRDIQGKSVERNALAIRLSQSLQRFLVRLRQEGFSGLRALWEHHHAWQGRAVSLTSGAQQIDGVVLGIDEQGALRLKTEQGTIHYSSGELSLRLRDDS
ncbi:bifunctional biotin--[acetyl-CoA-carboxylase] ligase/biotin operon repressor BirA [Pseudomonas mangiferae]|uniref:Bifunctional ligase/repressor BirA n=1 Tax=Pseudomonas mangiferae TaxID=2593654 RepID=A0A553GU44_9PSED|nr:bifunctional biotin--[acetyl-CoA-carboxylase] ligase/biotin operon repressor BirA [Pseudomonas mangiferae]TRX73019.1 bifunctional biotin--[acetyl-CoA-carboxylase] ligase/biotin operon repressor BirA [Pseudomonas mangiferae]